MPEIQMTVGDKEITLEFNKFAKQAKGAVMVTCGETQVLAVVTAADEAKPNQDFLPLTVDYIEKFYAVGLIPSNYLKREGMPSQQEALTSRIIDRAIRPCFPQTYSCDTFVTCQVMSIDPLHHPAPLALLGASAALMISDIPFNGPIAGLRLGVDDKGTFIIDPDVKSPSRLDLLIAASPDAVSMIEAGADFLSEEEMLAAISFAREALQPMFAAQLTAQKEYGVPKRPEAAEHQIPDAALRIAESKTDAIADVFKSGCKQDRVKALKSIEAGIINEYGLLSPEVNLNDAKQAFRKVKQDYLRSGIINQGKRIDGRGPEDVRQLHSETSILSTPHGSALFQRGETQALATVTLGVAVDEQRVDSIVLGATTKRFMLHYNFPPFSVGEARPLRSVGRREIGHGALAERAIERALSSQFNYTVRLVSEVLEADGSSSMATVCASTMALLDGGVPLRDMVAGIAMGLVVDKERYCILSDISDEEDHLGDMDFKVCGGREGITALQMDNKIGGLSEQILAEALFQAKAGREKILAHMHATISVPEEMKLAAPRVMTVKVRPDRIRGLIGPGGKMVRSIQEKCSVRVTIGDDGAIVIVAPDGDSANAAAEMIKSAVTDPKVGEVYTGSVQRILDFGAFIEIKPGVDGLCHISEIALHRVERIEDELQEGDLVQVKVLEIDRQGKIRLSRRALLKE